MDQAIRRSGHAIAGDQRNEVGSRRFLLAARVNEFIQRRCHFEPDPTCFGDCPRELIVRYILQPLAQPQEVVQLRPIRSLCHLAVLTKKALRQTGKPRNYIGFHPGWVGRRSMN
jgi:hypothetical protein